MSLPRLSGHAERRAIARHIYPDVVEAALERPEYVWPCWSGGGSRNTQSPGLGNACLAYQRGPLRVIIGNNPPAIVSVMWDYRMLDISRRNDQPDSRRAAELSGRILVEDPLTDWTNPSIVTDIDIAFPAIGITLTPTDDVPDDFAPAGWGDLVAFLFGHGSDDSLHLIPKDGIDPEIAWRHLRVVLGCYGLKQKQKMRGAAWLLSLWFEAAIWDTFNGECEAGDPDVARQLRDLP